MTRKAFIIGKFYPFHSGHQALLAFALSQCDHLSVLVCCSNKEHIPGTIRQSWIIDTFPNTSNLDIQVFDYLEEDLPNTSESSREVSQVWATILQQQFPDYNMIISSEPYGEYVAELMGIRHVSFDNSRLAVPVSASAIRNNLFDNWHYLPDAVKRHFAIKIVVLGTESTGKSTLTNRLAKHFNCSKLLEVGRELIPDSNAFTIADLYKVAHEHARRIKQAVLSESPLIIIDTDIHITQSYAQFTFGKQLDVDAEVYQANEAQLYLFLSKDVSYIQDGTRLAIHHRNLLEASHKQILKDRNINYIEIAGDWDDRFNRAVIEIEKALKEADIYRL